MWWINIGETFGKEAPGSISSSNNSREEEENLTEKQKKNKAKIKEKLDTLSEDERMQRIADLRQKAIMDEKAIYDKGLDDGIEQGIKQGNREKTIELAKKMIDKGIKLEDIIEITGLTNEEIENLQIK